MTADVPPTCPFCGHDTVERHYALVDGGAMPGCTNCERTLPLEEWVREVEQARKG